MSLEPTGGSQRLWGGGGAGSSPSFLSQRASPLQAHVPLKVRGGGVGLAFNIQEPSSVFYLSSPQGAVGFPTLATAEAGRTVLPCPGFQSWNYYSHQGLWAWHDLYPGAKGCLVPSALWPTPRLRSQSTSALCVHLVGA